MPIVAVNGAELYHEIRGEGPPLLMIMGATGDGGHFDAVARMLADEFTVITYDRRGNGRSHPPAGWTTTSAEEQADDAAGLLNALDLSPAAVFGTSSGGVFALCLLLRQPEAVRGAVLHEPALFALFDDPAQVRDILIALIGDGMAAGGPPLALERFVRFVAGDANWESFEPGLRQRVLASADTYFGIESGSFDGFLPNDRELAAIRAPVQVVVSDQSLPEFAHAARRLAGSSASRSCARRAHTSRITTIQRSWCVPSAPRFARSAASRHRASAESVHIIQTSEFALRDGLRVRHLVEGRSAAHLAHSQMRRGARVTRCRSPGGANLKGWYRASARMFRLDSIERAEARAILGDLLSAGAPRTERAYGVSA